jgi:hypothetical protein
MTLDRHTTTVYVLDSNGNVVDFTSSGGTSMVDDAAFTAATSSFVPTGGIVTADSVDSGDGGAFAMLANRQQKVTLYDSSGNELSVGGGTQYTQGDTDASITGTAMLMEGAADTLLPVQGTVADGLLVNLGSNNDVTVTGSVTANAGTNLNTSALLTTAAHDAAFGTAGSADAQVRSIQGIASMTPVQVSQATAGNLNVTEASAAAALTALQIMDDWDNGASDGASVSGDVAHNVADAGEPVKIGFVAYSPDGTAPGTAAVETRRTNGKADLDGRQYVSTVHPEMWSYHDDDAAAVTTDGTLHADPGDGFAVYITDIVWSIGAATASTLFIEEGATKILGPYNLPATIGAGMALHFTTPKKCTASTAILITNTGSINFAIDVMGFVAAV